MKNKKKVIKEIEPWGVNIPYLILGLVYWGIGGISAFNNLPHHFYFMMIGTYSIYFGMISRLFFPARNYLATHLTSLFLLAIPYYPFQALASLVLIITELWSISDIRGYGSRFPLNLLVLSSPFASLIGWIFYVQFGYFVLVPPLLLYLLGVNIGVFSATLGIKAKLGFKQFSVFILVLLYPISISITIAGYVLWLLYKTRVKERNLSSILTLSVAVIVSFSSLFLGEQIHAFAFGVMIPFFFNCITYSTSRYNYGKLFPIPILSALSYFMRFVNLPLSSVFFISAVLIFLILNRHNFTIRTIKLGMLSLIHI
ncbi:hypothetical protein [Sulfolobus acidocaldarius]|uniref:hypothetical protein n=1 Tax=Sulfolobus acidocaldarius TaxID=2285 RepID=UPI0007815BA2|nr:hypothetical protein [Sulfolobus acidocaldarius]